MRIDTLIINADTLTMAGEGVGYVDNAAIVIDSGKIVAVVPMSEAAGFEAEETIDATRKLVLPGFIDGHMHAGLALFRGLAQDTRDWMMRGQKPYSSRMEKEYCLPASHMNMLEALAAGTTTFGEYSFPDQSREQAEGRASSPVHQASQFRGQAHRWVSHRNEYYLGTPQCACSSAEYGCRHRRKGADRVRYRHPESCS